MYPGKPNWFSLLAFILMAGLLGGCDIESQSVDESKYSKGARGEIKSVKPDARKLVLKPSSTEQGEGAIHFKLAQDATVTVLGKEAQLTDLKAYQRAEIQYSVQEGRVHRAGSVKVTEQPPVVKTAAGQIATVQPERRKIILKQGETVKSFKVAQNATITLNGQNAELADLKAGQQTQIQYLVQDGINRASSVKIGETAAVSGPTPG